MFDDGPEFFLVLTQLDTEGNILTKFLKKKTTSGLGGDAITRNVYRRTDGRRRVHRPYEKLLWTTSKKGPQKGPQIE